MSKREVTIVNPKPVIKALQDLDCGKTKFAEIRGEDFSISAFEIPPPENYAAPKNFPSCCEFHQTTYTNTLNWFERFPDCCEPHRKLKSVEWFDKTNHKNIAHKTVTQLSYTEHIIKTRIDAVDWYDDITDYIEFSHSSFGQLPIGFGAAPGLKDYLGSLQHFLRETKVIDQSKLAKLSQFVNRYYDLPGKEKIDFNILDTIYTNWLRIFPFDISYFRELKIHFEKRLPILKGQPSTNRYSGVTKIRVRTESDLVEWLVDTTKQLLKSIKSQTLIDRGVIDDANKHALELVSESHRINQEALLSGYTKGESEYVKVLKRWIVNEKNYFKEISLLRKSSSKGPKIQYPPVNEDVFEDLVCDLFNAMYPNSHYTRFGKKGNEQKGIDIISISRKEAIQCKKKDLSRRSSVIKNELRKDFESDILNAMKLDVDIDLLIFTSTFENNATLEEHLQKLRKKHNPKFNVTYIGWNSLSSSFHDFETIINKYY